MAYFKIIEEGAFADYEFIALGETKEALFAICALATFEAMADMSQIQPVDEIRFDITAENDTELLFAFLAELIYLKDVEKILLVQYDIKLSEDYKLSCIARGEKIDQLKHDLKTDVKAVTYHHFELKQTPDGYSAHVILDL